MRRRVFLQNDLPGAALMVRVGVGMEEAECDGADVERFDAARRLAGACLVKRAQHLACVTDSLGNLEAQMPRDDRLRLDPLEVVHAGVVGAHDLEHIPKPPGGDQRGLRQFPLEQRVEHDGRAVHEIIDIGERDGSLRLRARVGQDPLDAAQHTFLEVAGRRQGLGNMDATARVQEHQVGEGAADVGGESRRHCPARRGEPMALSMRGAKALPGFRRSPPAGRRAGRC